MNDRQAELDSATTSTIGPFIVKDGRPVLRADFKKLYLDIIVEIAQCQAFLQANPNHATYVQGTIVTGHRLNVDQWLSPNEWPDKPLIPEYAENVRQWQIPGTSLLLTDSPSAQIVAHDEKSGFPRFRDPIGFDTIAELERLLAGLRALRA